MPARALVLGALVLALTACGVTGNFRNDPGYAEFDSLRRLESEERFALSLGPLPLRLAHWVLDEDDAEIRPLLDELRAVRVYTFEGVPDEEAASGIEALTSELLRDGWLNVVAVREGEERVSVLLRPGAGGTNRGLTVVVHEPNEVVLVNLIGNVRLDVIGGYMGELDLEVPAIAIEAANLQARELKRRSHPASETDP